MVKMNVTSITFDTCPVSPGCKVTYEWDADLPQEQRSHTVIAVEKCAYHAGKDKKNHMGKRFEDDFGASIPAWEENVRKNRALGELEAVHGKKADELGVSWRYEEDAKGDRVLHLDTSKSELNANAKTTAQSRLDQKVGAGKVIVD